LLGGEIDDFRTSGISLASSSALFTLAIIPLKTASFDPLGALVWNLREEAAVTARQGLGITTPPCFV
jgi:hypothetical protein